MESERILRPADESIEEFDRRWREKLEKIADCQEEILENAAIQITQASRNGQVSEQKPAKILIDTLIRSLTSRFNPLLLEYQSLSEKVADQLKELKKNDLGAEIQYFNPPKLSGLPAPSLTQLDGITISEPSTIMGISRATKEMHFRRELREKAEKPIEGVLKEFVPRIRHWYMTTVSALKDSYHNQTDPLRFRGQGTKSVESADLLRKDMEQLKTQVMQNDEV
jgi:hypothetical protein